MEWGWIDMLQYVVSVQKFYSLRKQYNKIQRFKQRLFVPELETLSYESYCII